mmetsp:Transcript_32335/g.83775  ORF Transcript_32335/g.83775 Transcript_32335/m.83775 type:complete len:121 (-) Transcript_32335:980-1342(-)
MYSLKATNRIRPSTPATKAPRQINVHVQRDKLAALAFSPLHQIPPGELNTASNGPDVRRSKLHMCIDCVMASQWIPAYMAEGSMAVSTAAHAVSTLPCAAKSPGCRSACFREAAAPPLCA